MKKTKKILIAAFLLATSIVLSRFLSIRTPIISIGFSFIPIMLTAILLGYKYSMLVGMLSDLIGALLFPTGPYFPGFTLSGILAGFIYGILLYRNKFVVDKKFIIKLIISVLLVVIIVNGLLNTIWIIIITKNAAKIIVPIRIIKQLVMAPIQIITMYLLTKAFEPKIKEYLIDNND